MIEAFDTRTALLPLPYVSRKLSIDKEFIVDYHYGRFFINKDGIVQEICRDELLKFVNNTIDDVLDTNSKSIDFNMLIDNINNIDNWISDHTIPNGNKINTFKQLSYFLSGMEFFDFTIKEILDNKVNMVYGKTLSDNNLGDKDVEKLESIGYGAKTYIHPKEYLCDINKGVYKLNGYPEPGEFKDIHLSSYDIGLGNIDPEANYYEHPKEKQCDAFMIESLNGMTGDVEFTKSTIGLPDMKNMPISSPMDYRSNNSYASPIIIENYLNKKENAKNIKATDTYISDKIVVQIKNTKSGQLNKIMYNDNSNIIEIPFNVFIEDLYALDGGDKLMILSNNKLLLYEYKGGIYEETNIFDGYNGFHINILDNNKVKRIIEPRNGVYGVILTNNDGNDFIYTWGRIRETSKPYKHNIEKVEIVGDIMYILFDTGKVEYKEYLDGMIDDKYREIILTYNDIINIFVRKDYFICMRGNRSLIVAGDDTQYNNGIPSKLKNSTFNPYRIYVQDDIVCILSADTSMTMIGRSINNLPSKFQYPIDKVTIYKNKVIFIDEEDNMISIL